VNPKLLVWPGLSYTSGKHSQSCPENEGKAIMVRSKPKREKREETTEEFVKRINQQGGKPNGLRRRTGRHHKG